jgi:hypothetical protein
VRIPPTTFQAVGLVLLGCGLVIGAMSPAAVWALAVGSNLLVGCGFVVTVFGLLQEVRGRPPQHF